MLTREDLENDTLRKNREQNFHSLPLVSEQEFNASLERILADWNPKDDVWVFCYGSLIWNPLFHYTERRNVTVHGFHRSFCLRSRHGRGSVEEPGLMLG
ncbi:MAG: gamma-glutamylcyclotransferase, partial [Rhodocyclales bacterium]|nr:gamma-glutamylcyclotransferase [Rhodocyclales bacterium]